MSAADTVAILRMIMDLPTNVGGKDAAIKLLTFS